MAAFNAAAARQEERKEKNQSWRERRNSTRAIYPVRGITEKGYIELVNSRFTIYAEIFQPRTYDLDELTTDDADALEARAWATHLAYTGSIKEIFQSFPENNQKQQQYFKRLIERTSSPTLLEMQERELNRLKQLEKTYRKLSSWIWVFGDTENELESNAATFRKSADVYGLQEITVSEKKMMLNLMNNPEVTYVEEE